MVTCYVSLLYVITLGLVFHVLQFIEDYFVGYFAEHLFICRNWVQFADYGYCPQVKDAVMH